MTGVSKPPDAMKLAPPSFSESRNLFCCGICAYAEMKQPINTREAAAAIEATSEFRYLKSDI
jgi:hypothetical protein